MSNEATPKDKSQEGPYKPQGDYNILAPNGDVTIFRGSFERDEIMRMLNAAHAKGYAAGQEAQPSPAGLTADKVMEIIKQWIIDESTDSPIDPDEWNDPLWLKHEAILRARLEAIANG